MNHLRFITSLTLALAATSFSGCEPVSSVSAVDSNAEKSNAEVENLEAKLSDAQARFDAQTIELDQLKKELAEAHANRDQQAKQLEDIKASFMKMKLSLLEANEASSQLSAILIGEHNEWTAEVATETEDSNLEVATEAVEGSGEFDDVDTAKEANATNKSTEPSKADAVENDDPDP